MNPWAACRKLQGGSLPSQRSCELHPSLSVLRVGEGRTYPSAPIGQRFSPQGADSPTLPAGTCAGTRHVSRRRQQGAPSGWGGGEKGPACTQAKHRWTRVKPAGAPVTWRGDQRQVRPRGSETAAVGRVTGTGPPRPPATVGHGELCVSVASGTARKRQTLTHARQVWGAAGTSQACGVSWKRSVLRFTIHLGTQQSRNPVSSWGGGRQRSLASWQPVFEAQVCHLLDPRPSARFLSSLRLGFFICRRGKL